MVMMSIIELKPGIKLAKDVHTPLGGLLLSKGRVILPRDLEILRAFLVQTVEVDMNTVNFSEGGSSYSAQEQQEKQLQVEEEIAEIAVITANLTSFEEEYERMVALTKRAFKEAAALEVPVFELRTQLSILILHLKNYQVLYFSPRSIKRDEYMYHNAVLTALTSYLIAQWCELPQRDLVQVALAGLLHNIGNIKVSPEILFGTKPLSKTEEEEVRKHTTYGYTILKNVRAINDGVRLSALQHHEKIDGSGYPLRLEGHQIHTYSKIVAVADIFHAMTLERPYKSSQSPYLVLEQIMQESFGKLDPKIVQTFIRKVTQFHNGTVVELSDHRRGSIIFTDRDHPTRPMVAVEGAIVNLVAERQLYIKRVIIE
ncbi:HD-GYP domain-containing protein [Paenibacillus provencensis]|uniref:HD-GYP domain-containing protein n=1 Tax=Paenibacillus provencensis TaxID=441151 RepID=A0ABW3Q3K8_9BACL|nr:HD-GYP domain-containing protein [Paenibacillus sp. MER 78]MCM3128693.1 HD-GYP domain-containing protein [Paenibacillus sp. MER 78]